MSNGLLSIGLIIGILWSNDLLFTPSILGKVGYFPCLLLPSSVIHCSSYVSSIFDLLNKLAYYGSSVVNMRSNL